MSHDGPNSELFLQRWAEHLREQTTPQRDLIVAAFDEIFRINKSGNRFVGISGRWLIRRARTGFTVRVFRNRLTRELTALWLRIRFFLRWRRARRLRAELLGGARAG